jgi:hypothetical protein
LRSEFISSSSSACGRHSERSARLPPATPRPSRRGPAAHLGDARLELVWLLAIGLHDLGARAEHGLVLRGRRRGERSSPTDSPAGRREPSADASPIICRIPNLGRRARHLGRPPKSLFPYSRQKKRSQRGNPEPTLRRAGLGRGPSLARARHIRAAEERGGISTRREAEPEEPLRGGTRRTTERRNQKNH